MIPLVAGLVLFLGAHSVRIVADGWRSAQIARLGAGGWRALYALVSLAGVVLVVWGYGQARLDPVSLWSASPWMRSVTSLLVLPAFVLIVAGNMRGTRIRAALGHPMVLGAMLWAFAHILSNGTLGDVVLFGAFLIWSVAEYRSLRRRDRDAGVVRPPGTASRDALAVIVGVAAWLVFGYWLHGWLIGVRPF